MGFPINVVDPRLAAGRGEEFSASKRVRSALLLALQQSVQMPQGLF